MHAIQIPHDSAIRADYAVGYICFILIVVVRVHSFDLPKSLILSTALATCVGDQNGNPDTQPEQSHGAMLLQYSRCLPASQAPGHADTRTKRKKDYQRGYKLRVADCSA